MNSAPPAVQPSRSVHDARRRPLALVGGLLPRTVTFLALEGGAGHG
ncbi:hypothetical protein [Streptomyces sp. NPDC048436]